MVHVASKLMIECVRGEPTNVHSMEQEASNKIVVSACAGKEIEMVQNDSHGTLE